MHSLTVDDSLHTFSLLFPDIFVLSLLPFPLWTLLCLLSSFTTIAYLCFFSLFLLLFCFPISDSPLCILAVGEDFASSFASLLFWPSLVRCQFQTYFPHFRFQPHLVFEGSRDQSGTEGVRKPPWRLPSCCFRSFQQGAVSDLSIPDCQVLEQGWSFLHSHSPNSFFRIGYFISFLDTPSPGLLRWV